VALGAEYDAHMGRRCADATRSVHSRYVIDEPQIDDCTLYFTQRLPAAKGQRKLLRHRNDVVGSASEARSRSASSSTMCGLT
jgi:hypothetical protein